MLPSQPSFELIALNRTTFGARDRDIQSVQQTGFAAWVEDQLCPPAGDDPALDAYLRSRKLYIQYDAYDSMNQKWPAVNEQRPLQYLWTSAKELWRLNREVLFRSAYPEQSRPLDELTSSVFIRNTHSRYQLREVMTDFWLNHFSVSLYKGFEVIWSLIPYDRDVIRPNVFGNFRTMMAWVATSSAMLKYLDNADSNAQHPNENYAREVLELHTLGRGAYYGKNSGGADVSALGFTDEDVAQASHALSGWTIKQGWNTNENTGEFFFNPSQHSDKAGIFLGFDLSTLSGIHQGNKVLDIACAHPATATFITAKICKHLFGERPPPAVLARARAAWGKHYEKPDHSAQVLRAILLDGPEIGQGPQTKVRRPHERWIALARTMDAEVQPSTQYYMLNAVSDGPFSWPTPDGRPDDNEFWLNSSTNIAVWNHLLYMTYSVMTVVDFLAQTPLDIQKSPTLVTEYWVGRLIGYRLSDEAMSALTIAVSRIFEGYGGQQFFREAFGGKFISVLATAPEFVYH